MLEKAQTAYYVEQSVRGKRPRDGKIDFPWSAQEVQQLNFSPLECKCRYGELLFVVWSGRDLEVIGDAPRARLSGSRGPLPSCPSGKVREREREDNLGADERKRGGKTPSAVDEGRASELNQACKATSSFARRIRQTERRRWKMLATKRDNVQLTRDGSETSYAVDWG